MADEQLPPVMVGGYDYAHDTSNMARQLRDLEDLLSKRRWAEAAFRAERMLEGLRRVHAYALERQGL